MDAFINGIAYYLPDREFGNEEISTSFPEWSIEKISQKTGIISRHISADTEYVSDIAVKALQKLAEEYEINLSSIDYLILCTQSPDYLLPTTACIVQDRANLPKSCGAIDVNLGCSGYIYGLGIAKGLICSGQAENIIFITADTYSKIIHPRDKSNRTIFGDGAAATLITSKPNSKYFSALIKEFKYGSDGSGYQKLIVENSGIKRKNELLEEKYDEDGNFISSPNHLYMNGKEVFNFAAFEVPPLVEKTLERNSVEIEDITKFIFHQANEYMLNFVRKRCKIPESKFYVSIKDVGNTVSSSIPIAFRRLADENKLEKNNLVLLAGFGVGLSIGGVIVEVK